MSTTTAIITPFSGILGQTARKWRLEPSMTRGDVACFDGPFCRLVAGLSDRDENGDNQLLFLEIKCSGCLNQLKNRVDRW